MDQEHLQVTYGVVRVHPVPSDAETDSTALVAGPLPPPAPDIQATLLNMVGPLSPSNAASINLQALNLANEVVVIPFRKNKLDGK
jgi:hypothetical protein